jgi:uncharacterized protein YukE
MTGVIKEICMESLDEQDVIKLKNLLQHTGEFIAYFELVDSKMIEWRHDIERRAQAQQQQFQQQLQALQGELGSLQEMFTSAGIARFRLTADNALQQGQDYLNAMQDTKSDILKQIDDFKSDFASLSEHSVNSLNNHTIKSLASIDEQLGHYDHRQFSRIANESCLYVEKSANNAIARSNKLLRMFQWRSVVLTFATSLLTAFALGLYLSDELPWEIHQHVMNERGAGKLLMSAWPNLSQQEKNKIIAGEQDAHKA